MNEKITNIALIGNPNSGKTSVFNHLTGMRQQVGNFPGVTVDKKTGKFALANGKTAVITDLPGSYSMYPNSTDERILLNVLGDPDKSLYPDVVLYVADASNLERHLLLCTQIIDIGIPVVLALNMVDVAKNEGVEWDQKILSHSLNIPVVKINGRTGNGIDELKSQLTQISSTTNFFETANLSPVVIREIKEKLKLENDYHALLIAHHDERLHLLSAEQKKSVREILNRNSFPSIHLQVQETMGRFEKIERVIQKASVRSDVGDESTTEKIDKLLTHKFFGSLIFLGILFLLFQAIFSWATIPMDWIDMTFSRFASFTSEALPPGIINNLITQGIIPGIAGVCIFIPQITILFGLIAFLEDVGYMSRAVYLSDSLMKRFGLNGRSVLALFSGLACAVPAIMSTRIIKNWKERMITIMVTPLISCSARIPVFTILIAFAVPRETVGPFNLQGLAMMGLYLLGASSALAAAYVMKLIVKSNEQSYLVMELPSYKIPYWKNIFFTMLEKVKIFVWEAGRVILVISIILWFLSSYGTKEKMNQAEAAAVSEANIKQLDEQQTADLLASKKLEASFAGQMGKLFEPIIAPLGFDWKIGIALITSFAAREVFVGTLATLYSVGNTDDELTIREKMRAEVHPVSGEMIYNAATAMSLLIFYVFAMQCMSTVAVVYRETQSWKLPTIQFAYMTLLAYFGSLVTYQVMRHWL